MTLDAAAGAAAGLGPLSIGRARARARGFHGSHARRTAGPGAEFWQYRELQPGEAIDRVDWRRSGRSDHLYIREREREDPVRLWLWVDASPSMDFASADRVPTKLAQARLIAGALGLAAAAAGERVSDLSRPGERGRPEGLLATIGASDAVLSDARFGSGDAIVLVGDFLDGAPTDWIDRAATAGAVGAVVSVADPAEADFPFTGRIRFDAVEPHDMPHEFARTENVRADYLTAWQAHQARLAAIDTTAGWTATTYRTDTNPDVVLGTVATWLRG